jgi:hypothetical protein
MDRKRFELRDPGYRGIIRFRYHCPVLAVAQPGQPSDDSAGFL